MAELTEKSFKHLVAAIEAQMEAEAEVIVKNGLDQKPPKELACVININIAVLILG